MSTLLKYVATELECFGSECLKECGQDHGCPDHDCPSHVPKRAIEDEIGSKIDH